MQKLLRNNKVNQREELTAQVEAWQALEDLHKLLAGPGKEGLRVGELVNVAAEMGLLRNGEDRQRA